MHSDEMVKTNGELVERILDAAERPRLKVVPVTQWKGSDGIWRSVFGVPLGVTLTNESRIQGYCFQAENGTTIGQRFPSAEAAHQWQEERAAENREEFRRHLMQEATEEEFRRQVRYWLKLAPEGQVTR